MENILEITNLTKKFGGLTAVNNVDLTIKKGEVRGLIGPNGSGKTTVINLISGVYEPDAGKIVYNGTDITAWSPDRVASLGLLRTFQIPRLFGNMTLVENLLIPRFPDISMDYFKQRKSAEDKAKSMLKMVGLQHLSDQKAKVLSGGQKALLQMARGFMVEDISLFLLDEPFAGVNIVVKDTIMELVRTMVKQGVTFVLVSHEMASVRQMCDKVTVLAEGRIITEGSMDEIVAHQDVIDAYLGGG